MNLSFLFFFQRPYKWTGVNRQLLLALMIFVAWILPLLDQGFWNIVLYRTIFLIGDHSNTSVFDLLTYSVYSMTHGLFMIILEFSFAIFGLIFWLKTKRIIRDKRDLYFTQRDMKMVMLITHNTHVY
jgi:hypothetical protein